MKRKIARIWLSACLTISLAAGVMPAAGDRVKAAEDLSAAVESGFVIKESDVNQLLKGDLELPQTVKGLEGAEITYSVGDANPKYVSIENNKTLKVTRPFAGDGNYKFTLEAVVSKDGSSVTKNFPLTIWEGLSEDSYAGYLYVCFSCTPSETDVQQIHFFLSEDGLNWTALNGCKPVFLTGTDYTGNIVSYGKSSIDYYVKEGTDIAQTVTGDASVLFPFEGNDQGVRDPYLIRGCRSDGSDSNKIWLLATDLNTHARKYNGNPENSTLSNSTWGQTSEYGKGSRNLFVYETEDWIHWTRRYIDVGKGADGEEIGLCMAWAPEAIYNPQKDNYLVYWSGRTTADDRSRDRLYCSETKDFVHFGPTKLYETEPFYQNYGASGKGSNSGYGNIDTSQLWVAGKDQNGNETPYGTLYRLVKDETNNHIELMGAGSVLDPAKDYDSTNPIRITPYTLGGKAYGTKEDLSSITGDANQIKRAEIVQNWFVNESVGNHFQKISQKDMEKYTGAYEGATMFKFIDRDEWCVMIDYYGSMKVRYEPYITSDLSKPDSIVKMTGGYGRTGGDIGTHGGMIPITASEYNALIDTYNDRSKMTGANEAALSNYHEIDYITMDVRPWKAEMTKKASVLEDAAKESGYSDGVKAQMKKLSQLAADLSKKEGVRVAELKKVNNRAEKLMANRLMAIPEVEAESVAISSCVLTLDAGSSKTLSAEVSPESAAKKGITWSSSDPAVAKVSSTGAVTAEAKGTAVITASSENGKSASCKVTVK